MTYFYTELLLFRNIPHLIFLESSLVNQAFLVFRSFWKAMAVSSIKVTRTSPTSQLSLMTHLLSEQSTLPDITGLTGTACLLDTLLRLRNMIQGATELQYLLFFVTTHSIIKLYPCQMKLGAH